MQASFEKLVMKVLSAKKKQRKHSLQIQERFNERFNDEEAEVKRVEIDMSKYILKSSGASSTSSTSTTSARSKNECAIS